MQHFKVLIGVLIFLICFSDCKHNEYDAEEAAKYYCDCLLNAKQKGLDFFDARAKCDGQLLAENKFFRIDYMDRNISFRNYTLFLPQKLLDSVGTFSGEFYSYVQKNCCKEAVKGCDTSDSLQMKVKAVDTLHVFQFK